MLPPGAPRYPFLLALQGRCCDICRRPKLVRERFRLRRCRNSLICSDCDHLRKGWETNLELSPTLRARLAEWTAERRTDLPPDRPT